MGIISWIKNKYSENRFQRANELLSGGDVNGAVDILAEIIDKHVDAPSTLLSIYHRQIEAGEADRISDVTELLEKYPQLRSECINFASRITHGLNAKLAIGYLQSLYYAGVQEIKSLFVNTAQRYVIDTPTITNLKTVTSSSSLISALSESLHSYAKQLYSTKDFTNCKRICEVLLTTLNTKDFYELYTFVQFDSLALKKFNSEDIVKLDILFQDAKNKYYLSDSTIKLLKDKGLKLAQNSFDKHEYLASLLVSQRLIDYTAKARQLYVDSALKLYKSFSSSRSQIVPNCLYIALGNTSKALIKGLEPFLAYNNSYREKYLEATISELTLLMGVNRERAEWLFIHAWSLCPDVSLIKTILSNGPEKERITVASHIIDTNTSILNDKTNLTEFFECLKRFSDIGYVADAVELILRKGIKADIYYEWAILELAKSAPNNSRRRVEIISRGLRLITTQTLFACKAKYLRDYIASGQYDKTYCNVEVKSLNGKNGLADVLAAHMLLDEAKICQDIAIKECKLREALSIRNAHNKPFDKSSFEALVPKIANQITKLAKDIYSQNANKAKELLYLLRDNNLKWFDAYASLFLASISSSKPSTELVSALISVIKEGSDSDSAILTELWSRYWTVSLSISKSLPLNDAIEYLQTTYSNLNATCSIPRKSDLIESVNSERCRLLMERGKNAEKNKNFPQAVKDYESIISLLGNFSDVKTRIFICKIKSDCRLSKSDIKEINKLLSVKKNKPYQNDLAYRWCIYLIKHNDFNAASEINKRILDSDPELTQICQEEIIKAQQKALDQLNEQIAKLNDSSLTAKEATVFGNTLSKIVEDINLVAQISQQKIRIIKEAVRVLAIKKFYENGDFLNSMKGLKAHDSSYLSDPISLRNIAIMAVLAAEAGLISQSNYKELVAIWITAIYQQKLFVDSLDYTSWDDPYTFSLCGALGQLENKGDDLPDNVNYADTEDANVVSILEVQRYLLRRMETAIQDNAEYQLFFNSQLEAMNKLASQNLDEHCVIVAPYLLSLSNSYKEDVFNSIRKEASQHYGNWEEILEIGCMYGLSEGDFALFANASEYLNIALDTLNRRNSIDRALTLNRISAIKDFPGLMSQLVSSIISSINAAISNNIDYKVLYASYGKVVKALEDESVSFMYSNYINQQVVRSLNEKTTSLADGAKVLYDIYSYCKCNPHLRRNLMNITEALIHNYITDGDENNISVLDKVLSSSREFDKCVVNAIKGGDGVPEGMMLLLFSANESRFNNLKLKIGSKSPIIQAQFASASKKIADMKVQLELSDIVEKVTEGKIKKCDALQKVYHIYQTNKTDARVCENLAALIPMCVMEYIVPGAVGHEKVIKILDALKTNMSSTYKAHASEVKDAYDMIWNSLPIENRMALQGSDIYRLNENGLRLKKGLDYLKALK